METIGIKLLFVVIFSINSVQKDLEWQGRIGFENNIKLVINPSDPFFGKYKFELEEELSIGNDDDENFLFYRVRDIAVDYRGNIYIADMSNCRIQKFSKFGKFLKTFGRRGQGPGEFEAPRKVRIHSETGDVYVLDGTYSIEVFDKHGKHLKEIQTKNWLADFRICSDKSIISTSRIVSEFELKASIGNLDSEGRLSKNYATYPYNRFMERKEKGIIIDYTGYEQELLLAGLSNEHFVFGHSQEYKLNVIKQDGQLLFRTIRDIPPVEFSRKEKRRMKQFKLGNYKPFFYFILTDSEGRIYVQTNKTWNEEKVIEKDVDIFSSNGIYLYKSKLPRNTFVIKDGYLYTLEVDDAELIKRYRINNWDQIRIGKQGTSFSSY